MRLASIVLASTTLAAFAASSASADLVSRMNIDNGFNFYFSTDDNVQGTLIGSGSNWTITNSFTTALVPGNTYYLHVQAVDVGVIAAWIGQFNVDSNFQFGNGTQQLLTNATDGLWRQSNTGWGSYTQTLTDAGANGVAPWGTAASTISSQARWLGYGVNTTSYFSATITTVVPLPPAAYAGLSALAGVGCISVVRRRRNR